MSAEKNELQDEGFAIALTRLAGPNRGERERKREKESEREREIEHIISSAALTNK